MFKKLSLAFLTAALVVAGATGRFAQADVGNVGRSDPITASGVFPWVGLSGQSWCVATVKDSGTASTISATVETADSNFQSVQTVTSIGTISAATTGQAGTIVTSGAPLSYVRLNVASFAAGSGTTTYSLVCGPQGQSGTVTIGGSVAVSSLPPVTYATPCGNPNTQPCPAKTSPPGFVGTSGVKAGGATTSFFYDSWPDTLVIGTNQTSANTYEIVAGIANQTIYLWQLSIFSTGTNTAATVSLKIGSTANCAGAPAVTFPGTLQIGATAGINTILVGAMAQGSASAGLGLFTYLVPATTPLIVVSGATPVNVCITTVSATESWQTIAYYGIHAN